MTIPDSLQAMTDQGFEFLQAGQFDDAIDAFTTCLAVYPETAKAFLGRAIARFQIKDWKLSEQDFRRANALNVQEPEGRVGLGVSLAMQNKIYPALDVFEALLTDFPDFVRGYIQLGMMQIKLGAISKGREYLNQALTHRPSLAERQFIESVLKEQQTLDAKRHYRPDFEALRKGADNK